eukprot:TRINITY_DN62170_c0_g4_i5.p1 TRINITY_DN62170_c0_g4~~TRINITY_DN62170_c0_g4_i5.p1  ORF type:complete len:292 (+),score=48.08 TRINITY_DN62170_c0_g4_i5:75-950(+)
MPGRPVTLNENEQHRSLVEAGRYMSSPPSSGSSFMPAYIGSSNDPAELHHPDPFAAASPPPGLHAGVVPPVPGLGHPGQHVPLHPPPPPPGFCGLEQAGDDIMTALPSEEADAVGPLSVAAEHRRQRRLQKMQRAAAAAPPQAAAPPALPPHRSMFVTSPGAFSSEDRDARSGQGKFDLWAMYQSRLQVDTPCMIVDFQLGRILFSNNHANALFGHLLPLAHQETSTLFVEEDRMKFASGVMYADIQDTMVLHPRKFRLNAFGGSEEAILHGERLAGNWWCLEFIIPPVTR